MTKNAKRLQTVKTFRKVVSFTDLNGLLTGYGLPHARSRSRIVGSRHQIFTS